MPDPKTIIHELSEDELLQIAQGEKAESVIEKVSEAAKFIYARKIREGRESISAMLVYHTYKQYKGWDNKRQAKRFFFKDFNKYFTPHRNKDGIYYLLDPRSFDTSPEEYWRMRADARYDKSKKKTKT
jgi:hypothetical protein